MLLRVSVLVLLVYGGLLCLTYWGFTHTPDRASFPTQDKGYLLVNVQLPDAASRRAHRRQVMRRIEQIARRHAGRHAHGGHRRPVAPAGRQRARTSARCT